jgi:hypothetical protein
MGIRSLKTASISTGVKRSKVWDQSTEIFDSDFELIERVDVSSTASSITFSSIPSTYKHLQVRGIARSSSGSQYTKLRFNNDSSSVYTYHGFFGSSSAAVTDFAISQNGAGASGSAGGSTLAGTYAGVIIDILDYANSNKNTTTKNLDGFNTNGGATQIVLGSGLWVNTAAVNRVDLIPSASTYAQYSSFALYGIKGV